MPAIRYLSAVIACCGLASPVAAELPAPLAKGLVNPESVAVGGDGRTYVSAIGERLKDGDGGLFVIEGDKAVPFATGLNDPKGLLFFRDRFYVTDRFQVWSVNQEGKAEVFVQAADFPAPPLFLNDIEIDRESGTLYVSDSGDLRGAGGAVYGIHPKTKQVTLLTNAEKIPGLHSPNGLLMDGASFLYLADLGSGQLHHVNIATGSATKLAEGFSGADGLVMDKFGRVFLSSWKLGKVWGIPRPGVAPILMHEGFQSAADICTSAAGTQLLVPDMQAGTVTSVSAAIPGWEVDERPLPLRVVPAFNELVTAGWKSAEASGKVVPLRPIVLTHAGDGTNRVFLATEQGVIHVFPNNAAVKESQVFLDIRERVRYSDKENEEGLLGLAFHPNYKQNGEFFVFYTDKRATMDNVVSRFRVKKDDPNQADPASEEKILRITKPYWNHNGGTLCFGPDGYLYITHGDGGKGSDPHENGQNPGTLLGKILRIDVNSKTAGKNYAVPADNPFVNRKDAAPEVFAVGLRNVWRMAFDRKTGQLWAGDVGQNLWEEIVLVRSGGNYGWSVREGQHPFGAKGVGRRDDLIEPIWEYHHDLGKSITGGLVYRGQKFPELNGAYLYSDYVSGKLWALWYDKEKGRVVANRPLAADNQQVMSFGEDEQGEVYLLTVSPTGKGIWQLAASPEASK